MQPALRPGDRLLVATWSKPRPGDIIIFRDPEWSATFGVKRVEAVQPDGTLVLRGDNPNVSRDSRHFGFVSQSLLVGRVVYRYLPAGRRGRL